MSPGEAPMHDPALNRRRFQEMIQRPDAEIDLARAALIVAAENDPLWRMPLWRPYRNLLDSPCADLNNVAKSTFAGSIIAALYLAEFVSTSTRWAHLDIYGFNPATKPGRPEGGEATAMRALYAYLRGRYA